MTRALVALVLAAFAVGAGECRAAEPVRLQPSVHARAVAPGEPLRLVVRSSVPLTTLEAMFLERAIFMAPFETNADGSEAWSGWGMVGLLEEPEAASIEVRGTARDGRPAHAVIAVRVDTKDFPVEELKVAPKYVSPPKEVEARIAADRARLAEIYERRTPVVQREPFVRPVDGAPTGIFGARRVFNGKPRSPHSGLDLRASTGTPIRASGPGRVVLAYDLYYSGNTVILDHGGGLFTLYAHLSRMDVAEGEDVAAGDVVGLAGATGRVTGPHLHWGAKIGADPFDPRALLDPALFP